MSEPAQVRKEAIASPVTSAQETVAEQPEHEHVRRAPLAGLAAGPPTDPLGGTEAPRDVTAALRRRQGQGRSLPADLAEDFGARLGTDLSNVRVHADTEADTISRSVQAAAFTHGNDVYFSSGAYQPASKGGQRLLAHELAHVAQERGAAGSGGGATIIGRADDPVEAAADRVADQITAPQPTGPAISRSVAGVPAEVRRCRDAAVIHRSLLSKLKKMFGIPAAPAPAMAGPAPVAPAKWTPARPAGTAKKAGPKAGHGRQAPPSLGYSDPGEEQKSFAYSEPELSQAHDEEAKESESNESTPSDNYVDDLKIGEGPTHDPYSEPELTTSGEQEAKEDETGERIGADNYVDDLKIGEGPTHDPYSEPELTTSGEQEAKEDETGERIGADNYVDDLKIGEGPTHDPYSEPELTTSGEQEAKEDETGERVGADNYVEVLPEKKAKKKRAPRREPPVVEEESKEHETGERVGADNYVEVLPEKKAKKKRAPRRELPVVQEAPKSKPSFNYILDPLRHREDDESKESEGSQAQGPAPLPSGESKRPKGTGESRQHRAFQMMKLPDSFKDETKAGKSDMSLAIHGSLKVIKMLWTAFTKPDALTNEEIVALKAQLPPKRMPVTVATTDADLKGYAKQRHVEETTKLRREELDVTDDGILMHTTAAGRVPYPTVDGKPDGEPVIEDRVVKYDDKPEDQEKTRVEFRGGKLFRSPASDQNGAEVDTAASVTHQSGAGYEIFAVDPKNEVHMASHKIGKYHHSSLLAGGNVAFAGEMKVDKGKLTYLSNKSGHYVPSAEALVQFLHFLEKDGVAMDFRVFDLSGKVGGTAAEVLAGKSPGKEDAAMTYEAIKTNVVWASFVEEFGEAAVLKVIGEQGWTGEGKDIVDGAGKAVDLKVVRRLLKQELGAKKRNPAKAQGGRAKIKLDTNQLNLDKSVSVKDTKWVK